MTYGLKQVALDAITGSIQTAPKEESERRYAICQACPNFRATLTCSLCGCFMPAKVKLTRASCPDSRW